MKLLKYTLVIIAIITAVAVAQSCTSSIFDTRTDGTCHNLRITSRGRSRSFLPRIGGSGAARFSGTGGLIGRGNPRVISNRVSAQPSGIGLNLKRMSRLLIFIGQFIDHDMTLTLETEEEEDITIARNDPRFGGEEHMEFRRSAFSVFSSARQFRTENTAWLDLGNVYGDNAARTNLLRAGNNGLMRVQIFQNCPFPPVDNRGASLCGDVRCEENVMLFAFHTLFLREHNRLADLVRRRRGGSDETIFRNARLLNIMQYQSIVWDSYLPYLLGRESFQQLTGPSVFNDNINPIPNVLFSTAAYRYGHSGVSNDLRFTDLNGRAVRATLALENAYGAIPGVIAGIRTDPRFLPAIFAGQSRIAHDILDSFVVDGLRNELLANAPERRDLIALNIQRGRGHGLQSINFYRQRLGLPTYRCNGGISCWLELTGNNRALSQAFLELYGSIENGDAWVVGMAEVPRIHQDSQLGDTFTRVIANQFNLFRNGDRIWYDRILPEFATGDLVGLQFPSRLSDVIVNNLAQDLNGLSNMLSAFALDGLFVSYIGATEAVVEFVVPQVLRNDPFRRRLWRIESDLPGAGRGFTLADGTVNSLFYRFDRLQAEANNFFRLELLRTRDNARIFVGELRFRSLRQDQVLQPLGGESEVQESGPSGWATAGIVLGSVAGLAAFGGLVFLISKRRNKQDAYTNELV